MRKAGVLMPVSALPSRVGAGELGEAAFHFIELLKKNHVKIWQILPLNPVGYGNSPYQPYSSCAGDEIYISLDKLAEDGLLKTAPEAFLQNAKRVDYEAVRQYREPFLREAFEVFTKKKGQEEPAYKEFAAQEWVYEYGVFRALKKANNGNCWNDWAEEDRNWPENRHALSAEVEAEAQYQMFLQYIFYTQWMDVKKTANEAGIEIMGDVPFYVGQDSVDVWGGKDNFLLDTDGRPIFIAGVPPDYFSATGQRWGNPIYDWEHMKEQNYQFWVKKGDTITIPNDPTNGGRALQLLAGAGLLKLKEGVGHAATVEDIIDNPLRLRIVEVEAATLPRTLDDARAAVINQTYALPAGLNPVKDSLLIESKDSPYANMVAIRTGDNRPELVELNNALHTPEVKQFILEHYKGSLIPSF